MELTILIPPTFTVLMMFLKKNDTKKNIPEMLGVVWLGLLNPSRAQIHTTAVGFANPTGAL